MFGKIKVISITVLLVLGCFTLFVYTSCNKQKYVYEDECKDVACQNGGTCLSGKCNCNAGFEGEFCEKAWLSRYVGQWDVKQTITTSSKPENWGKTKNYRITIRAKENGVSSFYIDNFMGNSAYNGIYCKIGVQQDGTLDFISTNFIMAANQLLPGSKISLTDGEGSVNSLGTSMGGKFEISYTDSTRLIQEVITFDATYVN